MTRDVTKAQALEYLRTWEAMRFHEQMVERYDERLDQLDQQLIPLLYADEENVIGKWETTSPDYPDDLPYNLGGCPDCRVYAKETAKRILDMGDRP